MRFIVVAVAEIDARDPLTAWQQAHRETAALRWEVASVAPAAHPEQAVTFTNALTRRLDRVQTRRRLVLSAGILAAFAFPSHLALTALFPGI